MSKKELIKFSDEKLNVVQERAHFYFRSILNSAPYLNILGWEKKSHNHVGFTLCYLIDSLLMRATKSEPSFDLVASTVEFFENNYDYTKICAEHHWIVEEKFESYLKLIFMTHKKLLDSMNISPVKSERYYLNHPRKLMVYDYFEFLAGRD